MTPTPTVYVVDDDEAVRDGLLRLFLSVDLTAETYPSGENFFANCKPDGKNCEVGCIIVDLRMPGMSAFDIQAELETRDVSLPLIFITGHGDIETGVRAMKAGAFDFVEKPFRDQALLEIVQKAIAKSAEDWENRSDLSGAKQRIEGLTPREREVLDGIISGEPNKRIAHTLGLSEKTVEFHRANLMKKMEARSLADLIQKALKASAS